MYCSISLRQHIAFNFAKCEWIAFCMDPDEMYLKVTIHRFLFDNHSRAKWRIKGIMATALHRASYFFLTMPLCSNRRNHHNSEPLFDKWVGKKKTKTLLLYPGRCNISMKVCVYVYKTELKKWNVHHVRSEGHDEHFIFLIFTTELIICHLSLTLNG